MVQRKTDDPTSKDCWESLEKLARTVREKPDWMKVGTPSGSKDPIPEKPEVTTKKRAAG